MAWLVEILLFALPFLAYALWRRLNPGVEPGPRFLLAAAVCVALVLLAMLIYGFSLGRNTGPVYVPPHFEDGRLVPGHLQPR